jgi:beta-galactosidase/beta-glucuronidase
VKVESAVAKSSWRDAKLSVSSVLENRSSAMAKVLLDQYCVLDGGVKYRLPSQKTELAPGAKTTLKTEGVWTEAKPWGIGGKYGEPVLYELVSDLYVDGKLVDRLVEPFGFREFWIAGSDFYLNGKRIILHGDVGFGSGAFSLHNKKVCEVVFPLLRPTA